MKYTHRYIARIKLQAETALFVGSGETSLINDALVQRDHHGFPMIQGTSLMGVLRHALEDDLADLSNDNDEEIKDLAVEKLKDWQHFFGYHEGDKGVGSKVRISSAYFVLPDGKVAEGLSTSRYEKHLKHFQVLPARQHVSINHRGVAKKNGLFENEVVYKGCQFIFELEVKGDGSETEKWEDLLKQLSHPLFRIGQGTRNGYGKLEVIEIQVCELDLRKEADYNKYLHFNPSLNENDNCLENKTAEYKRADSKLHHYRLKLRPDSFFIFGSGYGDDKVDNTPYVEEVLSYVDKEIILDKQTVIPASSIKGAISHRTCFHYNKLMNVRADEISESEFSKHLGENNKAVAALFGVGAGDKKEEQNKGHRGNVIIDDLYYAKEKVRNEKILNHVAIDRFTGGAMDGALFSETVSELISEEKDIVLEVYLEQGNYGEHIQMAFEKALEDICKGLLPLGGMTTKGHGIFEGELYKVTVPPPQSDGVDLKENEIETPLFPKLKNTES